MITIVDYGMGNLVSIQNMIRKIGGRAEIISSKEQIAKATAIILPGVGHFGKAMEKIQSIGIADILARKALEEKVPVLGICLGMQLLMEKSEEGKAIGLGWIPGEVLKFRMADSRMKIPHMGWNHVNPKTGSTLFQ